jgi:hypothetical protein
VQVVQRTVVIGIVDVTVVAFRLRLQCPLQCQSSTKWTNLALTARR